MSDSVQPHRRQPTRLPRPWGSPGKNTGVGCLLLLQCVKVKSLSRIRLPATPWTAAHQAPPSMGFSRQEYWSGLPLLSPQCRRPRFNSWVWKIHWRRDRPLTPVFLGCPCGSAGKESTCNEDDLGLIPWVGKISWEDALEKGNATHSPVFWPGEFHGVSWTRLRHFHFPGSFTTC